MRRLPAGTVTLLFADVEGSTRLLHLLGERFGPARARMRELVREAAAAARRRGGGLGRRRSLPRVPARAVTRSRPRPQIQRSLASRAVARRRSASPPDRHPHRRARPRRRGLRGHRRRHRGARLRVGARRAGRRHACDARRRGRRAAAGRLVSAARTASAEGRPDRAQLFQLARPRAPRRLPAAEDAHRNEPSRAASPPRRARGALARVEALLEPGVRGS